jgi:hypothetical protein
VAVVSTDVSDLSDGQNHFSFRRPREEVMCPSNLVQRKGALDVNTEHVRIDQSRESLKSINVWFDSETGKTKSASLRFLG